MAAQPLPRPPRVPSRVRTALGLLLPLAAVLLGVLAVAVALVVGGRWLLGSEAGTKWLLARLPGVEVEAIQGTLLGPNLQAGRVRVRWGTTERVEIEDLRAAGLGWQWRPAATLWLGLEIASLEARKVTVDSGPPSPRPLPQPAHLSAPLQARIGTLQVNELAVDHFEPLRDLQASGLHFDGRPDQLHRVVQARASGYGLVAQASGSIGNLAPLPLAVQATLRPASAGDDAPPWAAVLRAQGPLAAFDLQATLRGVALRKGPAPALDLAALTARAPQTRLSGEVQVHAASRQAPVAAHLRLDNTLPGRWDERRAPVARLELDLQGELARPDRIEARRIEIAFADARGSAGRLQGQGLWQGTTAEFDGRVTELAPQRLDKHAAAMTLGGTLTFKLHGIPTPGRPTGAAVAASGAATALASGPAAPQGSAPGARPRPADPWRAEAIVTLEGRIDGAPQPVQLSANGSATAQRVELRELRAQAGTARAQLRASAARDAAGDWALDTAGTLVDFDPVPWWPGDAGSAWRQGPHRLNADWQLELRLPRAGRNLAPLALLQSLAGNGRMQVHDSRLAGVPLAADLTLSYGTATGAAAGTLRAALNLGGNGLQMEGRGEPTGSGDADRWRAELDAANLSTLAPLARLHPALADWVPRQGRAHGTLAATGRWPHLATQGQVQAEQLRAGGLSLQLGQLNWQLDLREPSASEAPLQVRAKLGALELGGQRADTLQLDLRGTRAEHRVELEATLPVAPPAAAARVLGLAPAQATRASLAARGQWQPEAGGGGRWRAQIDELTLGPAQQDPQSVRWAEAKDLHAELRFDAQGRIVAAQAEPGRLRVADALALRWDAVQIDLRGERTDFVLRADFEPFALAPLLARAQPEMGWQGDLRLGARVALRAAERFEAELAFERRDGDLHVTSGDTLQRLGLSDFRLALQARDGVWDFEPLFKGQSLGEITGRLRVRTTPERRWPHADAPIEGTVQARVADLGIWSHWVPPGWRLTGELRTQASVGGRFGAPTYTGEASGSGVGVRNLLQGVNVSGGQVLIRLAGETARIEHFKLRGTEGEISVSGEAVFGSTPSARLQLVADKFRLLGRVDRMLSVSGAAEMMLGMESSRLDGRFRIDEGLFDFSRADAPSLDDDVTVSGAADGDAAIPAETPARGRRSFALGIDLDLGQQLRVRGRGIDTGLRGQLRITNPGGRLAVNGAVQSDRGTYAAYGQKLEIERGVLTFSGPPDNPRLDVFAIRPNLDARVGLQISGALRSLRVRLVSEPEMAESEKLSWLVLGRASEGLGRNDTVLLQRAAVALLAGEGEAPTDALMKTLGIDELSIRQGDGDVRETVVALGKQLSRRWYLGYERGVNATSGTWQLIYRIAQRLTVRAQSGLENSLDVIWTWRFQEPPAEGGVRKSLPATPR